MDVQALLRLLQSCSKKGSLTSTAFFRDVHSFRVARENEAARRVAYYGVAVALEQILSAATASSSPPG